MDQMMFIEENNLNKEYQNQFKNSKGNFTVFMKLKIY